MSRDIEQLILRAVREDRDASEELLRQERRARTIAFLQRQIRDMDVAAIYAELEATR